MNTQVCDPGQDIDVLLKDPAKRVAIIQRLATNDFSHLTPSGTAGGSVLPTPFGTFPTPSGMFPALNGVCPFPAPWFPFSPFPAMPAFPWINLLQMQPSSQDISRSETIPSTSKEPVTTPSEKGIAKDAVGENSGEESGTDSDIIECHLEDKEYGEFDPKIKDDESWQPPDTMASFLEEYFNQCLEAKEQEAILNDCPKPQCDVLQVPKLDPEVREQLSKKGKDPQFGSEKTLYKIQEQLLEVTGPLS